MSECLVTNIDNEQLLEELKDLRNELEVYKQAYAFACNHISKFAYPTKEWYLDFYLKKARGTITHD